VEQSHQRLRIGGDATLLSGVNSTRILFLFKGRPSLHAGGP